jgi:hypothetical protein
LLFASETLIWVPGFTVITLPLAAAVIVIVLGVAAWASVPKEPKRRALMATRLMIERRGVTIERGFIEESWVS